MTIKAFFLNHLLICKTDSLLVLILCALVNTLFVDSCLANSMSTPKAQRYVIAQNNSSLLENPLPPPPPLSSPNVIIKTQETIVSPEHLEPSRSMVQNSQDEYIFSAPTSTTTNYKVEVFGKSNFILKQVREVEPKAFIKGNIIQVGIFGEEDNAIYLVKQLTLQGLWARIVVE